MRRDEINESLKEASFDFFYWFSRFEFALKENGFLKDHRVGAKAEPNWSELQKRWQSEYVASPEAQRLIELHPKRQFVVEHAEPAWKPVGISHCNNDLCRVIAMLLTVRNNLFHGGKHGDSDVDRKERNLELLICGKIVLDQLANMADFIHDYERCY